VEGLASALLLDEVRKGAFFDWLLNAFAGEVIPEAGTALAIRTPVWSFIRSRYPWLLTNTTYPHVYFGCFQDG
jgi:hypothetical protein